MTIKKKYTHFFALGGAVLLVILDQLTKRWAVANLLGGSRREVIPGLFYLTYVENRGAAFGMFQGGARILSVVTGVVLLALFIYLLLGKAKGGMFTWCLATILAGGVGNLIDRVLRGYVVDFLDFSALFGFPVFNLADCCVVIGTLLLVCCVAWSDLPSRKEAEKADVETAQVDEEPDQL